MASASRAAYFPVGYQHQAFPQGPLPPPQSSPHLQPAQPLGGTTCYQAPSFTPTQALAPPLPPAKVRPHQLPRHLLTGFSPSTRCPFCKPVLTRQREWALKN